MSRRGRAIAYRLRALVPAFATAVFLVINARTTMTARDPLPHPPHGGNLDEASACYGVPDGGWIDLSTGINPHPYPLPALPGHLWTALPQAGADDELRATAATAYDAPDMDTIVPAPGTQALIQILPWVCASDRMAFVGPTYGEYAPAWRATGADVSETGDLRRALSVLEGAARPAVVVCNPNNPDGRTTPPEHLEDAADRLAGRGGMLVVDEAFADAAPDASLGRAVGRPGLVVLRSFGKFFGLAGLRLGFALAEVAVAERLRRALGPWAVAGPTLEIGQRALADADWIAATRQRLEADAARLDKMLRAAGFDVLGGTSLYRLTDHAEAAAWHARLARSGIWVRRSDRQPTRLRFGLPGGSWSWRRLEEALA